MEPETSLWSRGWKSYENTFEKKFARNSKSKKALKTSRKLPQVSFDVYIPKGPSVRLFW